MQRPARVPRRASAPEFQKTRAIIVPDGNDGAEAEDDAYYDTRLPNSTRRYYDTRGNQVIERGDRRLVIHQEPPKRQAHWLLFVGFGMFFMVLLWFLVQAGGAWLANEQNNMAYGMPRTYQTDAVVGHGDSSLHPSHFIALNLNGRIEVIEIPGGDPAKEKVYIGPAILSPNAGLVPVTLSFADVNGDGKPDMLIHIQGQTITYINTDKQFVASKE